jgi:hypothetical protein
VQDLWLAMKYRIRSRPRQGRTMLRNKKISQKSLASRKTLFDVTTANKQSNSRQRATHDTAFQSRILYNAEED